MTVLTKAQIDETLAAIKLFDGSSPHKVAGLVAEHLGINRSSAFRRIRKIKHMAEKGELGTRDILPGYIIKSIATKNEDGTWVKQTREPGEEFKVPEGHSVKGVSALVDPDGRVIQKWVKTGAERVDIAIGAIKEAFAEYEGRAEPVPPPEYSDEDLLSVYPIADQHNGLVAWGRETGESYDLQIGIDRLRNTMARLIAQSPPSREALILNLGDWTHQDSNKNATPASGHVLDVDGRYFKVVYAGVQLMLDCIGLALRKHEKVIVKNIPGNHDTHAYVALVMGVAAFYHNEPRVEVDLDPSDFYYKLWGNTFLGANHGHKLKPVDMALNMATRRPHEWGASLYRWCLFGHIHHETVKEVAGVRCESFQTLAAKDAYSHSSGYNSGQSLNSITLHKEFGEIGRHRINIAPVFETRKETVYDYRTFRTKPIENLYRGSDD